MYFKNIGVLSCLSLWQGTEIKMILKNLVHFISFQPAAPYREEKMQHGHMYDPEAG